MEAQLVTPIQSPGAMSYEESINYFVGKGKIPKAGIFDDGGKPLAGTPNMQINDSDVRAIYHCVNIPISKRDKKHFGLFIGQTRFICFKVDGRTLVGLTKEELFVAHTCDNVLIIAFVPIQPNSNVSCIGEVWTFAQELKSHMEVSQFVQ